MDENNIEFLTDFILKAGADSSKTPLSEHIEKNIRIRLRAVLLELSDKYNGDIQMSRIVERLAQDNDVMLKGFSERLEPYIK